MRLCYSCHGEVSSPCQEFEPVPAPARKPTLTLIARKCGVSKMTVSRVLRNEPNVSGATRELVMRVAEKVGFQPSGCYHVNHNPSTQHYYVLFQREYSAKDAFFRGIIFSIQAALFERGWGCSFGVVKNDYAEFLKLNRILRSQDVSGILVVGEIPTSYANVLQTNFLNLVFIDYPGDPGIEQPYNAVCTDNVYGGHLAMNHLLKLGRKRVLLIGGRKGHYFSNDLLRAYEETLREHSLGIDPRLITDADFHVTGGYEAAKRAREDGVTFDAIFSNDEMACGAIKALKQAGIKVPTDVSVVGFDGLPIGEVVSPALTTIVVDREKMGRLAVKRLLALEQEMGTEERYEKVGLFPKLLIRESCGARIGMGAGTRTAPQVA